jgi:L-aminopeptidase/D-esterase-like protein|uniref:Peptidase S58 family protein n=1 Tax=Desulfomonile tiedjei TaxID=2358 RepID=A0A7C4ATT9_9BACT
MYEGHITDVSGIRVGHASDVQGKTGVTVILAPSNGAVAGIHIGGSAPSTRQADSLTPLHIVERIHAICLCGGSAFGLDAAGGVLRFLERNGVGFHYGNMTIPIAPAAAIFDLNFGDSSARPDADLGAEACECASADFVPQGSVGAGTGATVGKLYGVEQGMKGGIGTCSVESKGGLRVGALVVVNAYGDITDLSGRIMAGARTSPQSLEFANAVKALKEGSAEPRKIPMENTTLAVVAVNARLHKIMASRIASQATVGLGRVIRPFHSPVDGDLTIVLGLGEKVYDPTRISLLAAEALQKAVMNAVMSADGFGIIPSWNDTKTRSATP